MATFKCALRDPVLGSRAKTLAKLNTKISELPTLVARRVRSSRSPHRARVSVPQRFSQFQLSKSSPSPTITLPRSDRLSQLPADNYS